ncbi:MAG: DegT/DnrJ/EryC1/StrS aminotransferase family protein [Pirellulales bacterium]|nr:DegT/DnrJ/EryC1/StrS aminotransferase family protein [Pirellulales bacterium]
MRFDIGWADVAFGVRSLGKRFDREALHQRIADCWPAPERMFTALSVRTAYDLMWKSLELPPGSEVLMSALTIPDMVRVVKHHQLVPVPVDLDLGSMAPDVDTLRRAITPATRAIVVAHLFGTHLALDPIVKIAKEHNLRIIEDCAQGFEGCRRDGHPGADVTMFSFGPIKTITAFGGGVFCVRDAELLARMQSLEKLYPVQSLWSYVKRFTKYSMLTAMACRPLCDVILTVSRAAGWDYDHWINTVARAFPGPRWLERLRYQPSGQLLAMLERRLRTCDTTAIAARAARGRRLAQAMPHGAMRPAGHIDEHTYWVFPILARDPKRVIAELAGAGFDATQGCSLRVIDPPEDRPELDPCVAREALAGMVFLPMGPAMPRRELERMGRVLGRLTDDLVMDPQAVDPSLVFPRIVLDLRSG